MKLTVYDKGNSHPAMTYKGKRVVTVNRDGTIYLSKVLTLELGLKPGDRVCVANNKEKPKDWYLFRTDDEQGFTIWNDARCGRFSNSYIAGMILDAAKVERCAGFMVDKDPVENGGMKCYRIILTNLIPKGLRAIRGKVV